MIVSFCTLVRWLVSGGPFQDGGWSPDWRIETFSPTPDLWRVKRGWRLSQSQRANYLINRVCIMKPLNLFKNPNYKVWRASKSVNTSRCLESGAARETGSSALVPSPKPCLMHLFHFAFPELDLYSKPVDVSKWFSWVPWALLANYQPPGEGHGNPWFIGGRSEVWKAWVFEVGEVLWDWALILWGLH